MITQSDLGWAAQQYADFTSEVGGKAAFSFILEAYSLSISSISDPAVGTISEVSTLDGIVCGDTIIRVWNGTDQIYVGRLASEEHAEQSWSQTTLTATSLDEWVPPTLAASGDTCRLFWYDGTNVKYFESTDKGASWGSAVQVVEISGIEFIAATTTTRVHYAYRTAKDNLRLGTISYNGSWSSSDSGIYWPFPISSFDAVNCPNQADDGAASTNDILCFTSDVPPLIAYRVDGTELVQYLERRQSVIIFRWQNDNWSNHREYDLIDRVPVALSPARNNLRLSTYGDWIFMTYLRKHGSASYSHQVMAVTRSKTGLHWEQPYLLQATETGTCGVLLKRGSHVYVVGSSGRKVRANSTGYVDYPAVSHDITDYVISIDMRTSDMKELEVTVGNPEGVLDYIFDQDVIWQARCSQGHNIDGTNYVVQTILADIEEVSKSRLIPTNHRVLVGRDALSRLTTVRADLIQEWANQQMGGDNFKSYDDTSYSGLRHTAAYAGHWECHNEVLQLRSGASPGIGFNLQTSYVWNGSGQCGIKVAATDVDDHAGLVFRAHDKYNLWFVVFMADEQKIVLTERKNNVDTNHASVSAAWSVGTWYYLKVLYRYNQVRFFISTDGVSWTLRKTVELPGVNPAAAHFAFTYNAIPIMEGSQGYIGHGYSEYDPSYSIPPWTPPNIDIPAPIPEEDWPLQVYFAADTGGVYYTSTFSGTDSSDQPTWTKLPTTGDWPGNDKLKAFAISKDNPLDDVIALTADAAPEIITYNATAGTWADSLTQATIRDSGDPLFCQADATIRDMIVDKSTGAVYAYAMGSSAAAIYKKTSVESGTWTRVGYWSGLSLGDESDNLWAYGDHVAFIMQLGTVTKNQILYYSTNGGSSWNSDKLKVQAELHATRLRFLRNNTSRVFWTPYGDVMWYHDMGDADYDNTTCMSGIACWDIWSGRPDAFHCDPETAGVARFVEDQAGASAANRLYTTIDDFANYTNRGGIDIGLGGESDPRDVTSVADFVNEFDYDMIIYGSEDAIVGNPHSIFVAYGDTDVTPDGKSGLNPGVSPYTNSIPYNCGGPCWRGIQVVPPPE